MGLASMGKLVASHGGHVAQQHHVLVWPHDEDLLGDEAVDVVAAGPRASDGRTDDGPRFMEAD